jgi:hypothetical protein
MTGKSTTSDSMSAANSNAAAIDVTLDGTIVPLPSNQNLSTFSANRTSTEFTVPKTGSYLISYAVTITQPMLISSRVLRNCKEITASVIAPSVSLTSLSSTFITSLDAGDTLALQLFGSVDTATLSGGASTYLTVVRIA